MNDFFDNLKSNFSKTSKVISDKTKEAVELTKREVELQKLNMELNKKYKKLGELTYNIEVEKIQVLDETEILCSEITDLKRKIQKIKSEKDVDIIEPDEAERIKPERIKPEKNDEGYFVMKFCPSCSTGNHPNATECIKCGTKF